MTKGVIVQLKDVVYMSEQALRWTPEADGKGRFISGVTLYWEQSDLPVIKSHIVDLDDPDYNLEANILEQVLEYGRHTEERPLSPMSSREFLRCAGGECGVGDHGSVDHVGEPALE